MGWYPWTVPDEMVVFMEAQFERFSVDKPTDFVIDCVADYVSRYVAKADYYPTSPDEALNRYRGVPHLGLTPPEQEALGPRIEIYLKLPENFRKTGSLSETQLHLSLWAALLFCWSEQGEKNVEWYRVMEEVPRAVFPSRSSS